MKRAAPVAATLTLAATHVAMAATAPPRSFQPPLDRTTPVIGEIVVRGELRSSLDGSTFDAITTRDHFPRFSSDGVVAPRLGGLYDLEAGGLRVVEQDPERHVYRLAPNGAPGPACRAAGVDGPCLVPRLASLAHERLVAASEFAATLTGRLEAEALPGPWLPVATKSETRVFAWLGALAALLGAALQVRRAGRARRGSAIGQVRLAARRARRALRGEPTLARARDQIPALVARAQGLEEARRACAARLARLDPRALEARRDAWARSAAPDAGAALAALAAEAREACQMAADLSSAVAGLERIASSLRTLALRARADRGTRAVAAQDDPVEILFGELDLRDAATGEAEPSALPPLARGPLVSR